MGMFNPSFQELFKIYIELLRKEAGFKDTLLDPKHRDAFEQLLKEGWEKCYDAMERSGIPMMLDNMNLLANVHNNHEIEKLEKRLLEIERPLRKSQLVKVKDLTLSRTRLLVCDECSETMPLNSNMRYIIRLNDTRSMCEKCFKSYLRSMKNSPRH